MLRACKQADLPYGGRTLIFKKFTQFEQIQAVKSLLRANFSLVANPYQFPLSRDEFRRALKQGLGRALEFVEKYGLEGYRDILLAACLKNQVHDAQCEQERAEWLSKFFDGSPAWLTEPLYLKLCQLNSEEEQSWHQWTRLALLLARRGADDARRALYRGFRILEDGELVAAREIMTLDGAKGLLWISEKLDKAAQLERSTFLGLLDFFDETHGEGAGLQAVRSSKNPRLQGFLRRLDRPEPRWKQKNVSTEPPFSAREALERLDAYPLSRWLKSADPEEIESIAGELGRSRDPEVLEKILFCFMNTGLPRFDPILLKLAEYPYGDVARRARWVMANHAHPDVRSKALEWLASRRLAGGRLRALRSVLQETDLASIEEALNEALPQLDDDDTHDLLSDVLHLADTYVEHDAARLLEFCYEYSPCTQCRRESVDLLLTRDRLPDWIAHECRWDCTDSIRELVSQDTSTDHY